MAIDWKQEYKTGEETIDEQHELLFIAVNRLGYLLESRIYKGNEIDKIVLFLRQYVQTHFRYEECCMIRHRCPVAARNKAAHERFIAFYTTFADTCSRVGNTENTLRELHTFMESWLVAHITSIDQQLGPCLGFAPDESAPSA